MSLIQNIRIGHATNSSSSHSIVMLRPGANPPATNSYDNDFGWDEFVLADAQSKMRYLAVDTRDSYGDDFEQFKADFIDFVDEETLKAIFDGDGYIDHDSSGTAAGVPKDILLLPNVVILGGNDNSEHRFTLPGASPLPRGSFKMRQDGDAKVYYWPDSGFKARFSPTPYLKSTAPELVDVKITDYCPYGCTFCYQGSTREGLHADLDLVIATANKLAELGVFEVAIGGGEPVMHPEFPAIIDIFHAHGITPNLTTFGVEWLTRPDVVEAMRKVGGIGVSVHSAKDLAKITQIGKALRDARIWGTQILPQHVVGTGDLGEIMTALREMYYEPKILLLGYKYTERGASGPSHHVTSADIVANLVGGDRTWRDNDVQVSVDTAFVDQYRDALRHLNVPDYLTSSPEGKFSMYIDLVKRRMAPSSYAKPDEYVPLDLPGILQHYARW